MSEPIGDVELAEWALHRADDAGRLARELINYRKADAVSVPKVMSSEQLASAQKAWNGLDYHTPAAVMFDRLYQAFLNLPNIKE